MSFKFGERLRELRKGQRISQRDLASLTGVDFTYVSKIETGDMPPPSAATIHRIAQALAADENELIVLAGKVPLEIYREIVREVAETDSTRHNDVDGCMYCPYCRGFQSQHNWLVKSEEFPHEEDCIVTKARRLVIP